MAAIRAQSGRLVHTAERASRGALRRSCGQWLLQRPQEWRPALSSGAELRATGQSSARRRRGVLPELHRRAEGRRRPVRRGQPGYGSHLDRDNDGTDCE
nr:excalibur calcium-binding domain-containing protein [Sphingosinithalassobacter sp. CS137]